MPMMQQPESYLGHITDESFEADGQLKAGPLKDLVTKMAHAFADWIDLMVRGRKLIAEDPAHGR